MADQTANDPVQSPATEPPRRRLGSLDAMRGFVIASMLVVNMTWDREALPAWLFHVPWNDPAQGATFTDLVFPWFVFIAGAAAPLSLRSGRGRGKTSGQILLAAARRAATLYLLGVLLTVASFAHERPLTWDCLLMWNILQLLGVAYFLVVAAELLSAPWRIGLVAAVLLAKWATFAIPYELVVEHISVRPIDGAPAGPGTWAHFDGVKQMLNYEFVAIPTIFTRLLGWLGMAQQSLPLAAIGVVGALSTEALDRKNRFATAAQVTAVGAGLIVLGFLLQGNYQPAGGGLWGTATVPLSKWLFSPAYCLLAAGTGCVLLAGFFAVIDVGRLWQMRALQSLGRNALAVYIGAELSFKLVFSKWLLPTPSGEGAPIASAVQSWIEHASGSAALAGLGWALLWLAAWWLVALRMDARGVYWRV